METNKKPNAATRIIQGKCPKCGQAHVFKKPSNLFSFPQMKDTCEVCGYRFDREPGYFLGAMYFSYALAVLQGITTFLICYFLFPALSTLATLLIIIGVVILFAYKNYKLSRIIYMHVFGY
jgi:uncharacterized protein (DUF983 family)